MTSVAVISTNTGRAHPERPRLTVRVITAYDMTFIETLKALVPVGERAFHSGPPKAWWVAPEYLDDVRQLVHSRFGGYRYEGSDGTYTVGIHGEIIEEVQTRLL